MALNGLFCADVPLRNYSLTHCYFACVNIYVCWTLHISVCVCVYVSLYLSVSLPEVPSLWDTVYICVDLPRDTENIRSQLTEAIKDYGRVMSHAPVQITDISARPAALLVHWAEVTPYYCTFCFIKKAPFFFFFIIHSNDDQFTQSFYQM